MIERALVRGELRVTQDLRRVAPPQAIAIGSPDAVIYDDDHPAEEPAAYPIGQREVTAAEMLAARPRDWLPSQGRECMDPPYERYCQGPRRAALPFGPEADLAERLELGTIQTVGYLLNNPPRPEWVRAAGGPVSPRPALTWPPPSAAYGGASATCANGPSKTCYIEAST